MSNPPSPVLEHPHRQHDDHSSAVALLNHDMMEIDAPQPSQLSENNEPLLRDQVALDHDQVADAEMEDLIANAKHASQDALAILDSLKNGRSPDQADQATLNVALMLHSLNEALENAEPRPNDLSLLQFIDYSFPFYEMSPETAQADLAELQKAVEFMGDQAHDHQTYVKYLTAIMDKENPEWVRPEEAEEVAMACQEYERVINMHLGEVQIMGGDLSELALEIENSERSLHATVAQLSDLVAVYDSFPDPLAIYPESTMEEQEALLQKMEQELVQINESLADLEPAMATGPETLADLDRELERVEAENALLEQEAAAEVEALHKVEQMHRGMNPEIGQAVIAQRNMIRVISRVAGVTNVKSVVLEFRSKTTADREGMAEGEGDGEAVDAAHRALVERVLGADAHRKYASPAMVLDLLDVRGSDLSLAVGDHNPYGRKVVVAELLDSRDLHVHIVLVPSQRDDDGVMSPPAPLVVGSTLIPQSSKVHAKDQVGLRRVVNTPADPFRAHKTLHQLIKRADAVLVRDALVEYLEQVGGLACTLTDDAPPGAGAGESRMPWTVTVSTEHKSGARVELMVSRESGKVVRVSAGHTGGWSRDKRDKVAILGEQAQTGFTFEGVLALIHEVLGFD